MGSLHLNSGQVTMNKERKSKRVHWEVMTQLEEAGEEDLCSLLNQVMGVQPYFGSGRDLAEYLEAIDALEKSGELRVRGYRTQEGRTIYSDFIAGGRAERLARLKFDEAGRIWKWTSQERQLVEVPEH